MTKQTLTVNLHNPRVQKVERQDTGTLVVTLANEEYNGTVDVFFEDAGWHELQSAVNGFLTAEKLSADQYCPDCNYIGLDAPDRAQDYRLRRDDYSMTKITEVPGVPTAGVDYRDPNVSMVLSTGKEAMIIIDNDSGAVTIHPATVAFGDTEQGQILVPGWRGSARYRRGEGTVSNVGWSFCLGDMICAAIAEGRIPLYSADDLPDSHRPAQPKGDGITDDTAAIQAGGKIKPGRYLS